MPFVVYQYLDSDDAHTFYEPLDSFESIRDLKAAIPGLLEQLIEGLKQIGYTYRSDDPALTPPQAVAVALVA
jgi:hypothetical protein